MKIAVFPGSFDPITLGHLDIIERASKLFDQLVVFISPNSDKNNEFTEEKRLKWLNESTKHLSNVTCKIQSGLVVEACKSVNATVLVRGIRNGVDCTYEQNMAFMNARLNEDIETVCLFTRPEYSLYSSSNVRELFKYGQDISGFVPACVLEDLKKGIEMTMKIRENYDFPIIFLSAKSEDIDKITGLNIGGDDYIKKGKFNGLQQT